MINCTEKGEKHYLEYHESRVTDKSKNLFGTVSLRSRTKKKKSTKKDVDLKKIHAEFTRTTDVARVRAYCVRTLLLYKITFTSLLLTKDGFLKKINKSDLLDLVRTRNPHLFLNKGLISLILWLRPAK